jgi:hypothetical protein
MSKQQLLQLFNFVSGFADKTFARTGTVAPMWHAVSEDGEHFVTASPLADKDQSIALIRSLFELRNVVRYIFIAEAWITKHPLDEKAVEQVLEVGVANYQDRVEIVMIMGEDYECEQITGQRRIIRPLKGKPRLGPLKITTPTQLAGRMTSLLPARGTKQ